MDTETEINRITREDIYERKQLLNNIDLQESRRYISNITYRSNPNKNVFMKRFQTSFSGGKIFAQTIPDFPARLMVPGTKSEIVVYSFTFDIISAWGGSMDDLSSITVDHEGKHAEDYSKKPWSMGFCGIQYMPFILRTEIRAYENQIRNFSRRNCSDGLIKFTEKKLEKAKNRLQLL